MFLFALMLIKLKMIKMSVIMMMVMMAIMMAIMVAIMMMIMMVMVADDFCRSCVTLALLNKYRSRTQIQLAVFVKVPSNLLKFHLSNQMGDNSEMPGSL